MEEHEMTDRLVIIKASPPKKLHGPTPSKREKVLNKIQQELESGVPEEDQKVYELDKVANLNKCMLTPPALPLQTASPGNVPYSSTQKRKGKKIATKLSPLSLKQSNNNKSKPSLTEKQHKNIHTSAGYFNSISRISKDYETTLCNLKNRVLLLEKEKLERDKEMMATSKQMASLSSENQTYKNQVQSLHAKLLEEKNVLLLQKNAFDKLSQRYVSVNESLHKLARNGGGKNCSSGAGAANSSDSDKGVRGALRSLSKENLECQRKIKVLEAQRLRDKKQLQHNDREIARLSKELQSARCLQVVEEITRNEQTETKKMNGKRPIIQPQSDIKLNEDQIDRRMQRVLATLNTEFNIANAVSLVSKLIRWLELSLSICISVDVRQVLQRLLQHTCTLFDCDHAEIFLVRNGSNKVFGFVSESKSELDIELPRDKGFIGYVIRTSCSVSATDAYNDPRFYSSYDSMIGYNTRDLLCVPVKDDNGEIMAIMRASNTIGKLGFSSNDEIIMTILAVQTGLLLIEAKVRGRIQSCCGKLLKLQKIPQIVVEETTATPRDINLTQVVHHIEERFITTIGASKVKIFLLEHNSQLMWSIQKEIDRDCEIKFTRKYSKQTSGLCASVIKNRKSIVIREVDKDSKFNSTIDIEACALGVYVVPILSHWKDTIGVIQVSRQISPYDGLKDTAVIRNSAEDEMAIHIIESFSHQISILLHELRMLETIKPPADEVYLARDQLLKEMSLMLNSDNEMIQKRSEEAKAAVKIQSRVRGKISRRSMSSMKNKRTKPVKHVVNEQEQAAIAIQKRLRGNLARENSKRQGILSKEERKQHLLRKKKPPPQTRPPGKMQNILDTKDGIANISETKSSEMSKSDASTVNYIVESPENSSKSTGKVVEQCDTTEKTKEEENEKLVEDNSNNSQNEGTIDLPLNNPLLEMKSNLLDNDHTNHSNDQITQATNHQESQISNDSISGSNKNEGCLKDVCSSMAEFLPDILSESEQIGNAFSLDQQESLPITAVEVKPRDIDSFVDNSSNVKVDIEQDSSAQNVLKADIDLSSEVIELSRNIKAVNNYPNDDLQTNNSIENLAQNDALRISEDNIPILNMEIERQINCQDKELTVENLHIHSTKSNNDVEIAKDGRCEQSNCSDILTVSETRDCNANYDPKVEVLKNEDTKYVVNDFTSVVTATSDCNLESENNSLHENLMPDRITSDLDLAQLGTLNTETSSSQVSKESSLDQVVLPLGTVVQSELDFENMTTKENSTSQNHGLEPNNSMAQEFIDHKISEPQQTIAAENEVQQESTCCGVEDNLINQRRKSEENMHSELLKASNLPIQQEFEEDHSQIVNESMKSDSPPEFSSEIVAETKSEIPVPEAHAIKVLEKEDNIIGEQEEVKEWVECADENGNIYFLNNLTGESSWTNPNSIEDETKYDDQSNEFETISPEWIKKSDHGVPYYENIITGESTWDNPLERNTSAEAPQQAKKKPISISL